MTIGILAIQGDFELHRRMLERLGIEYILVRTPPDLDKCDGLIIPGGESTTFVKLLKSGKLLPALKIFGQNKAIMGTCAGLITLAHTISNFDLETLNLIDIDVTRNAYGRQVDSFIDQISLNLNGKTTTYEGVFIRAPKIEKTGEGVKPIGFHKKDVVLAENDHILVATFHPELTDDPSIHEYFLRKVEKMKE
jgi:5'-phosphate synthase pdxT subunit